MASGALLKSLSRALDRRERAGRFISLPADISQTGALDFGSNDFLGISSGLLRDELLREIQNYPNFTVGTRTSRIVDVAGQYLLDLEAHLAKFHNAPDALFFNSGFDANVAIWSTLPQPGDVIVRDELVHASSLDGMKKSRAARQYSFLHNDVSSFEQVLKSVKQNHLEVAAGTRSIFIAVETVYSLDGDICPLKELVESANAILPGADIYFVTDEAQTNGVFGPNGSGLVCHLGLEKQVRLRLQTFGKALGSTGAVVLCDNIIKQTFVNYSRNFIFTTGPTFMVLASIKAGYRLMETVEIGRRRDHLQQLISCFYNTLVDNPKWKQIESARKLRIVNSSWRSQDVRSAIIAIETKEGEARSLMADLLANGFIVFTAQYPIVPIGCERIRIVINSQRTLDEVKGLVKAIIEWASKHSCKEARL